MRPTAALLDSPVGLCDASFRLVLRFFIGLVKFGLGQRQAPFHSSLADFEDLRHLIVGQILKESQDHEFTLAYCRQCARTQSRKARIIGIIPC